MSQELVPLGPEGFQYQHYGPSARSDDDQAAYDIYPDEFPTREDLLWEVRLVNSWIALGVLTPTQGQAILRGYTIQLDALAGLPAADEDSDDAHTWKLAEICRKHPEYLGDFDDKFSDEQRRWIFEGMADEGWDDGDDCEGAAEVPDPAADCGNRHEGDVAARTSAAKGTPS